MTLVCKLKISLYRHETLHSEHYTKWPVNVTSQMDIKRNIKPIPAGAANTKGNSELPLESEYKGVCSSGQIGGWWISIECLLCTYFFILITLFNHYFLTWYHLPHFTNEEIRPRKVK